ncbi:MAG TPA: DUF192 domain-containing protein [Candidatus Binatia bacterium]|nr:DUF192 domain-containing protein [Candidatus Binatia bacterium]
MRARVPGVLLLAALAAACAGPAPRAVIRTARGPVAVTVEVADTDAARERGLMYRTALAEGHGMLFVFPTAAEHAFWMKNTLIPLDMIFIADDRRIVGIHPDATPLSTAPIGVGAPSRFVLEVAGGFAARRGIAPGDAVELEGVPSP